MNPGVQGLVEWGAAAALALFTVWYQDAAGWRRVAVPVLGLLGCAGFAVVAILNGLWGMATLNGGLALIHGRNSIIMLSRKMQAATGKRSDRAAAEPWPPCGCRGVQHSASCRYSAS